MSLRALTGNQLVTIGRLSVFVGGQLKPLVSLRQMVGGQLRVIYAAAQSGGGGGGGSGGGPFTATATPDSVAGDEYTGVARPRAVSTNPTTAMTANGTSPFSYSWQILSGSMFANNPNSATTQFTEVIFGQDQGAARCTVTDALGTTATCDVAISLSVELIE